MNRVIICAALLSCCGALLSGCAPLEEQPTLGTYASKKAPAVVAGCVDDSLLHGAKLRTDGTNYSVKRHGTQYDFTPDGTGTQVRYRSVLKVNDGLAKVLACL